MKKLTFHSLRFIGLAAVLSLALFSCSKETDECADVKCNNGGVCAGGDCACTGEWEGKNCNTLNLKGVISGNASRTWKLSSITEAATGKVIPLDEEDKNLRLMIKSDGTWNTYWIGTTETEEATWQIINGNLYIFDKQTPPEKLEIRAIKWANGTFSYRLDNELSWGAPDVTGDVEFNYIQAN